VLTRVLGPDREGPPGWARPNTRSALEGPKLNEMKNKWRDSDSIRQARYARLAPSAPAAHQILKRLSRAARSTSRTSATVLAPRASGAASAAFGAAAFGRADATFLSMRVCRRSAASRASPLARSGAAAFGHSSVDQLPRGLKRCTEGRSAHTSRSESPSESRVDQQKPPPTEYVALSSTSPTAAGTESIYSGRAAMHGGVAATSS
jgi:hypothetical protein